MIQFSCSVAPQTCFVFREIVRSRDTTDTIFFNHREIMDSCRRQRRYRQDRLYGLQFLISENEYRHVAI